MIAIVGMLSVSRNMSRFGICAVGGAPHAETGNQRLLTRRATKGKTKTLSRLCLQTVLKRTSTSSLLQAPDCGVGVWLPYSRCAVVFMPTHSWHFKYNRNGHRWCAVIRKPRSAWPNRTGLPKWTFNTWARGGEGVLAATWSRTPGESFFIFSNLRQPQVSQNRDLRQEPTPGESIFYFPDFRQPQVCQNHDLWQFHRKVPSQVGIWLAGLASAASGGKKKENLERLAASRQILAKSHENSTCGRRKSKSEKNIDQKKRHNKITCIFLNDKTYCFGVMYFHRMCMLIVFWGIGIVIIIDDLSVFQSRE